MPEEVRVEIGGIGLLFRYDNCQIEETKEDSLTIKHFIKEGRSDFVIDVEVDRPPEFSRNKILFQSGKSWSLYGGEGRVFFEVYHTPDKGDREITHVCIIEENSPRARVYIPPQVDNADNAKTWSLERLMRVLGQLITISILHHHQGLLIHSSGTRLNSEGILFCGISGAGKTTLAQLWQAKEGVEVLSDDRVLVRREKRGYFVYGSPWPGEGKAVSCQKAPLKKIFFISKVRRNTLTPLEKKESFHRLITQCFPALWSRESIDFCIMFCRALVENTPCFSFGFVPDESAVEFVLKTRKHLSRTEIRSQTRIEQSKNPGAENHS